MWRLEVDIRCSGLTLSAVRGGTPMHLELTTFGSARWTSNSVDPPVSAHPLFYTVIGTYVSFFWRLGTQTLMFMWIEQEFLATEPPPWPLEGCLQWVWWDSPLATEMSKSTCAFSLPPSFSHLLNKQRLGLARWELSREPVWNLKEIKAWAKQ